MTEESKDCLQCRLISGGGLLAGGAYVIFQSKKVKNSSKRIITGIGFGLGVLGILRIFALPPFRSRGEPRKPETTEKVEDNEYIIGKFPPKLH